MQNDLEVSVLDVYARKNVIAIIKKIASKLFVVILLASVLIGMLAVIPEEVRAETWSIETVDSAGDVGWFTSIALDSNGYPHISYEDRANMDLKYAKWTGSKWGITTVDSTNSVGEYTSIALDSKGYAHISYLYRTNLDLKYAKWTGSKWSIETVDSTDSVGFETSIALDSSNNPHISYRDASNLDLKYAKWTGSKWSIETVDSAGDVGWFTSIALDSDDNPHISYLDYTNEGLKYAKWTGSKWSIETVDSTDSVGFETSIALDSKGYPHISLSKKDLKYAKWTGNKWSIETVDFTDCVGYGTSAIALDSNDNPHISYWDASNDVLKYAAELMFLKVPTQPRNLQATASDGSVNLKWTAPSDDGGSPITNYNIYRGTTSGGETLLTTVGNVLSYTDDYVINNQTYYYQVSAQNSAGEGEKSDEVREIDEGNNVERTHGIVIPPLEVSPTPTGPTPSPTTTPVREGPDPVPLILIVVAIATLGGITLIIRHHIITPHHKKWQVEAKEEEPPEHCQYCTHHCRKIELELDPAMRKIAYLSLGAYDPVHGEQIKEGQVTGEIVDGLNKVVSARHRRVNAEKLQELVTPQAHALLQQIMGLLCEELAPRDVSLTGHLEGGKVTCQFILYHCKRSGNVNIWEEEAKWEATIKDERDEPVGTLHSIAPSEPGISERLTPALTRLLMQFIEQV